MVVNIKLFHDVYRCIATFQQSVSLYLPNYTKFRGTCHGSGN